MTSWEVRRQDDNGNRYRVSVHDDRSDADAAVRGFEDGPGHKQIYWVVELSGDGDGNRDDTAPTAPRSQDGYTNPASR